MSAKILPWRPRATVPVPKPAVYLPALIDGQVTAQALIDGLASVGLALLYDQETRNLLIVAREEPTPS